MENKKQLTPEDKIRLAKTLAVMKAQEELKKKYPAKQKLQTTEVITTMLTIETEYAEMALWKMAENVPATLLRMEKEEPEALLNKIVNRVESALEYQKEALARGVNPDQAKEYMQDLLNPSYQPPKPEQIVITESQMNQILKKLIVIAKGII